MTIEAVYFDGGQRFTISIPQNTQPLGSPVSKSTSDAPKTNAKRHVLLFTVATIVLFQIITSNNGASKAIRGLSKHRYQSINHINTEKIKSWRSEIKRSCKIAKTVEDMTDVKKLARTGFPISGLGLEHKIIDPDYLPGNHMQRCPYVFLDLGSGVGNSVTDFIDSGLSGCQAARKCAKPLKAHSFHPLHLHADGIVREELELGKDMANTDFTSWVKDRINSFDSNLGPEDYCVYGVEGNPLLKSKLKSLEKNIARMDPSPLQHVHFLTRTVAAGEPGHPIYIDQAHEQDNSPGSSTFFSHAYIRESRQFGEIEEYKVDTKRLSALIKETLSHYDDESENNDMSRNHLILNIDVEGSEYDILNEVKTSGVLCDFARKGNIVDVFVQYHSPELLGIETADMLQYIHETRSYLERDCGKTLTLYERNTFFL